MTPIIEIEGGTVNRVTLDERTGIIRKEFALGNGVEVSIAKRLVSEWESMRKIKQTPVAKGILDSVIFMSYVDGEKHLDQAIDSYPVGTAARIYQQAGQSLADIHNVIHMNASRYHKAHEVKYYDLIRRNEDNLKTVGVSSLALYESLRDSYDKKEIDKQGLAWTHGDYWLNNLIGKRINGHFQLNAIIDWELAGLGSPYEDFAIVKMSIEDQHEQATQSFWKGYGAKPKPELQRHFAIVKTLEWMVSDEEGISEKFETDFYKPKIAQIRNVL